MCSFTTVNTIVSLNYTNMNLTSEILEDSSQVDGRSHPDAVLGQPPLDVAQHAPHGEDDPGLGGPGRLGRLFLSSSAGHGADSATSVGLCGEGGDTLITLEADRLWTQRG